MVGGQLRFICVPPLTVKVMFVGWCLRWTGYACHPVSVVVFQARLIPGVAGLIVGKRAV